MGEQKLADLLKQPHPDVPLGAAIKRADQQELHWASQTLSSLRSRAQQTSSGKVEVAGGQLSKETIETRLEQLGRLAPHIDQQFALTVGLSGQQPEAIIQNIHIDSAGAREILGGYVERLQEGLVQQEGRESWDGILLGDLLGFLENSLQAYSRCFDEPLGKVKEKLLSWARGRRQNAPPGQHATVLQDCAQWAEEMLLDLPVATSGLTPKQLWEIFENVQSSDPHNRYQLSNVATHPVAGPKLWERIMDSQPPTTVVRALVRHEEFTQEARLREQARDCRDPDVHFFLLDYLDGQELVDVFMELVDLDLDQAWRAWHSQRTGRALRAAMGEKELQKLLHVENARLRRSAIRQLGRKDSSAGPQQLP